MDHTSLILIYVLEIWLGFFPRSHKIQNIFHFIGNFTIVLRPTYLSLVVFLNISISDQVVTVSRLISKEFWAALIETFWNVHHQSNTQPLFLFQKWRRWFWSRENFTDHRCVVILLFSVTETLNITFQWH